MTEFLLQICTDEDADEPKLREKAKSIGTGAYLSTPTALRRRRSAAIAALTDLGPGNRLRHPLSLDPEIAAR